MIWVRDCLSLWSRVLQICCRFTQWSVTLTTVWLLTCWLERASRHPRAGCRERVGRHRDTGKLGSLLCEEGVLFVWDVALGENQNAVAVSSNKRAAQHTCDPLL